MRVCSSACVTTRDGSQRQIVMESSVYLMRGMIKAFRYDGYAAVTTIGCRLPSAEQTFPLEPFKVVFSLFLVLLDLCYWNSKLVGRLNVENCLFPLLGLFDRFDFFCIPVQVHTPQIGSLEIGPPPCGFS
jgi:hypothetical protein